MQTKRFDKELFDKNDLVARAALKLHLGKAWEDNPDKYGPDLILPKSSKFAEVEIKHAWKDEKFNYPDVNLAKRKDKWKDLDIMFYILNKHLTHAIEIPGKLLLDKYVTVVANKFVPAGELFYKIPIENVRIIKLKRQPITFPNDIEISWDECEKILNSHCKQMTESFRLITPNGVILGEPGDFLMKDALGQLYVCKEKVFLKAYRIV